MARALVGYSLFAAAFILTFGNTFDVLPLALMQLLTSFVLWVCIALARRKNSSKPDIGDEMVHW